MPPTVAAPVTDNVVLRFTALLNVAMPSTV